MFFFCLFLPCSWLAASDSLSLLVQTYIPTCLLVCVCMYMFVLSLFAFLSIPLVYLCVCVYVHTWVRVSVFVFSFFVCCSEETPCSWLPHSLFLLDLGDFSCPTTCCLFFFCLFFWAVNPTAGCLTPCFSSIQEPWFVQQPVLGPATRRFCRTFIACGRVRVSRGWVLRYSAWVKVLIFYHHLTCIWLCF
jgi:hypothetical protein